MQRTPGKTAAEREQYWTKIIEEARSYPAGVTAYCRENKINKNTYYKWLEKLQGKHPEWTPLFRTPAKRSAAKKHRETEVVEKARRRNFSAKEKAQILKEVDSCPPGKIAAILRREGIYHSRLREWQRERDQGALEPKKRGPKANPLRAEVKNLQVQLAKAEKQLRQANAIIELQKKISDLLGIAMDENQSE
jgi:transposase-like protein